MKENKEHQPSLHLTTATPTTTTGASLNNVAADTLKPRSLSQNTHQQK